MAKRATISKDLFRATEEGAPEVEVPAEGINKNVTVGLRLSEADLVEGIAEEYGISRNAVLRYAVRHFLKDYLNGRIDLASSVKTPPIPQNRLEMP